jgi:hypothetical protein
MLNRIAIAFIALFIAGPVFAQSSSLAQLHLVVVDQTGAGIPAATITVTPAGGGTPIAGVSDERGVADLAGAPIGAATLHVEFPGFLPSDQQITLKRGGNNQNVTLAIEGFQTEVVVSDTTSTDDRRGNAMSTTLEASEVAELPEDPDELADLLTQMAGGAGATFQVNGFRGGRLPSRDEIQQIRFRTNSFSADNHDAGRTQIEIITKPNVKNWSGNANTQYRSDAMNARNALATSETPEENRQFNFGLRGPLVSNKTSIRFNVDGRRDMQADTIVAVDELGNRLGDYVRRPSDSTNVTVGIEHAVSNTDTLRLEFRGGTSASRNNGVGGFNLPDRATNREGENQQIRAQLQSVIGKGSLNEVRLQYNGQNSATTSVSDAPAIIVQDAFSRGGAGANSENSSHTFELADNFDFNVGRKQQMRVGALLEAGRYNYFDQSNANGTFTFASIDSYLAGLPATYRIRQGQVNTDFGTYQLGFYWQDDIRVNSRFSFSLGVRNEMQNLIADKLNVMPRAGFTWTPKGNKTNVRGGYGLFHDWYEASLYDQTQRVNGVSQKDLLILDPGYPDPYSGQMGDVQPGGRIQSASDLKMPFVHQASIGIERQFTPNFSGQVSYQALRGRNQLRAININAPFAVVAGVDEDGSDLVTWVRPDPTVGNITQFESTGRSASDRLTFNASYRIPGKNLFMQGNYTLGSVKNYADSATTLPANNLDPNAEWGPSRQDVRHRVQMMINVPTVFGIRTSMNINAQSGTPYTITTGLDENKDGVLNDRPSGVGRNAARGNATWTMNMRLAKVIGIGGGGTPAGPGGLPGAGRPGVSEQRGPGGFGGGGGALGSRYSIELFASADNILNTVNYSNYSGNMLSKFFMQPTAAQPPRRIQIGMGFRF